MPASIQIFRPVLGEAVLVPNERGAALQREEEWLCSKQPRFLLIDKRDVGLAADVSNGIRVIAREEETVAVKLDLRLLLIGRPAMEPSSLRVISTVKSMSRIFSEILARSSVAMVAPQDLFQARPMR